MTVTATPAGFPAAEEIISAREIVSGFDRLAGALQPLIDAGDCILLGIMTGGLYPLVRLTDRLHGNFSIDYCHATRYGDAMTGGILEWREKPHLDCIGCTVIIVDDIYDEGLTLQAVARYCRELGAARVVTAVMLVKQRPRSVEAPVPDFTTGLTVPDRYVFGCGMDLHGRWRHLQAVYSLAKQAAAEVN